MISIIPPSEGIKKPIKCWLQANEIEEGVMEQLANLANLPFLHKWVAILPDGHQGYGMPIGTVACLDGYISPHMVGADIGCGMCAVKTSLAEDDITQGELKSILSEIRKVVPLGRNWHLEPQNEELMPKEPFRNGNDYPLWLRMQGYEVVSREYKKALLQLGTMGGNNHFIEIQKGSDGHIWIMIHSGSRNLGKQVGDYYNDIAKELNARYFSSIPADHELAFLSIHTPEGKAYMNEMNYCVDFALANRKLMMDRVMGAMNKVILDSCGTGVMFEPMINIAHNYARWENHYGKNVIVHRKGATSAKKGEIGIIPGSMGSKSYIVEGLGNPESFESCSHGAGRSIGRGKAVATLDLKAVQRNLDDRGIIHGIRNQKDVQEAPECYKDIDKVMKYQKELVKPLIELTTLAVIKDI